VEGVLSSGRRYRYVLYSDPHVWPDDDDPGFTAPIIIPVEPDLDPDDDPMEREQPKMIPPIVVQAAALRQPIGTRGPAGPSPPAATAAARCPPVSWVCCGASPATTVKPTWSICTRGAPSNSPASWCTTPSIWSTVRVWRSLQPPA